MAETISAEGRAIIRTWNNRALSRYQEWKGSWLEQLRKAEDPIKAASGQSVDVGKKPRPFDFDQVVKFKFAEPHHSSCIELKKASTVGLGHKTDKVSDALDGLCDENWYNTLTAVIEDYFHTGNGYLEVIRRGAANQEEITGLHFLPAPNVWRVIENEKYDTHFLVEGSNGKKTRYARFGEKELFKTRARTLLGTQKEVNELIAVRRPTSLDRYYGWPDWLACVPAVELTTAIHQYNFDFFNNRGVPEFILFLLGEQVGEKTWKEIAKVMQANIGQGNSHKTAAFNLPGQNIKVQLEKLALEKVDLQGAFQQFLDALALEIVSAHRVPPLLAGIQIPGKLGANNELPNALVTVQTLVIAQEQRTVVSALGSTLGNPKTNGGLGLVRKDFEFKTITEEIDLGAVAAVGASRTPAGATGSASAGKKATSSNGSVKPRRAVRAAP